MHTISGTVVFDLEIASPNLYSRLIKTVPEINQWLTRLRSQILTMKSAAIGIEGNFYRLKRHNRSICLKLNPENNCSDVIVLKGTEPVIGDFSGYLDWMQNRRYAGTCPILEHFPLYEGKAPGCLYLEEAKSEAAAALELQTEHLLHYGELARVPVPLLVIKLPEKSEQQALSELRNRLSQLAYERVEPYLRTGLGIYIYYYPAPPLRAFAVVQPGSCLPGQEIFLNPEHVIAHTIPGWLQLFSRLLWLGYFPLTPIIIRLGGILEASNACLDGGGCDLGTLTRMSDISHDGLFSQSFFFSYGGLRQAIATALGLPMGEIPQDYRQAIGATLLDTYLMTSIQQSLQAQGRSSLSLDPRINKFVNVNSLPNVLSVLSMLGSYLGSNNEYAPTQRSS